MMNKIFKFLPNSVPWSPRAYQVCISTDCNMKCPMCMRSIYGISSEYMTKDTFLKTMELARGKKVIFSGLGEPTTHPNFMEYIRIAKSFKTKLYMFTNGVLTAKMLPVLHLFDGISFSIDDYDNGHIAFDIVFHNLKVVSKAVGKEKMWVNIVSEDPENDTIHDKIRPYVRNFGIGKPALWGREVGDSEITKRICTQPWFTASIEPNGDIYPCCILGDASCLFNHPTLYFNGKEVTFLPRELCLGNVNQDDIRYMWNRDKLKELRKNLKEDIEHGVVSYPCSFCPYLLGLGY